MTSRFVGRWILASAFVLSACVASQAVAAPPPAEHAQAPAKNVILMVVDGCGAEPYTLARWFKGEALAVDAIRTGAVKTYIADSVVADSAPAASAFATGVRTSNKFISVGPHGKTLSTLPLPPPEMQYRPLATLLEGAKLLGKATGVVATSRVSHATPAAFLAHSPQRDREEDIMEQAVHQNADVVLGGGLAHLAPAAAGGKRADGEDLLAVLRARAYQTPKTAEELAAVKAGRVFGLFAPSHMAAEIDRAESAPAEPSLEEMTRKAVEILSQAPKGFFLMVEGSQVDWASHANDPAHLLGDLLAFDRAVAAALDFARKDGNTLLVVLSDHATGGLSIGNYRTSGSYSQMSVEDLVGPLRGMKCSAPALWKKLGDGPAPDRVRQVVKEFWGLGITDQDAADVLACAARNKGNPHNAFGEVLCPRHTALGWTTHGHTGGDVPLYSFGPGKLTGLVDGPEIGLRLAAAMGLDLDRLTRRLFVEPGAALPGAKVSVDEKDRNNPVVRIELNGKTAELPVHKNLLRVAGRTVELEGVVAYAPDAKKVYVPLQAVRILEDSRDELPAVTR